MSTKRHKPEEIVTKLRQVEVLVGQGMARIDAIRQISIAEQTYYRWDFNWVSKQTGTSGQNVKWGIEYTWANQGDLFGSTSIATATDRTPSDNRKYRKYKTYLMEKDGE